MESSPYVVLLEAHRVSLQRLSSYVVPEGSPVYKLHDDAQLAVAVCHEEASQLDDVVAVELHQGDHLLHRPLVIVLDPFHSAGHTAYPLFENLPKSTLA